MISTELQASIMRARSDLLSWLYPRTPAPEPNAPLIVSPPSRPIVEQTAHEELQHSQFQSDTFKKQLRRRKRTPKLLHRTQRAWHRPM